MKRVLILGSSGSGKSTLSRLLGAKLDLPIIYLDQHYWLPGWQESTAEQWQETLENLLRRERWIMDGTFSGSFDKRAAVADSIVFLDMPRWLCLWRVFKRRIRFHKQSRPDMTQGCPERINWGFFEYIWTYRRKRGLLIMDKMKKLQMQKSVFIIQSKKELSQFKQQHGIG